MPIIQNFIQPQVAYVHYETTNKSFVDMHYYLKSKGIQNNDFFLLLYDKGLAGIDPFDPNLPNHMKIRVLNETKNNFYYYLREILRLPQQGTGAGHGARFKLNRGNLAMSFILSLNYNLYVVLPRQFGKTTMALAYYLWLFNFRTTNSEITFLHKDHGGSKKNLRELKAIRELLPSYLRFDSAVNQEGKKLKVPNTIVNIQHPYNNNKITTLPSARTKESANNISRGLSVPNQYYDEFAFMPFNRDVYVAATPAFSRASQNAKANHAPYGILITTTPGDMLSDSGVYAYNMMNDATPWREEYYDMTYEQLEGLHKSNTKSSFFYVYFSYKQLGEGNEYFMRMVRELNNDWQAVKSEVLCIWQSSTNQNPFSADDLDKIKQWTHEPIRTLFFGKFNQYQMNIYENIDTSYPPIIGVDVAGATFSDSSAITIIDSRTTKVCATLNCNFIPYDDLADILYQIVTKWLPTAIISVERNGGFGVSVIQRLCKTSVKRNLYWEIKDKVIEESFDGIRMNKRPQKVKVYGVNSTKDVRARCIDILRERVMYHKDKFIAPILHDEMCGLEVKTNGKVEHSSNTHDDQIFSYLMALYVWYDGKNLAQNFGIMKNTLKTDDAEEMEEAGFEDQLEKGENIDLKKLNAAPNEFDEQLDLDIQWIENDMNTIKSASQFEEEQYKQSAALRQQMLSSDPRLRKNFEESAYGVDATTTFGISNYYTTLPDNLFGESDGEINFDDWDDYGVLAGRDAAHQLQAGPKLSGNLANIFSRM